MRYNIGIMLLFIAGITLITYPFISDFLSSRAHVQKVNHYETEVQKLTEDEKEQLRERAAQHNEQLEKGTPKGTSHYDAVDEEQLIGVLLLPKLKKELPVYHGTNADILKEGVGHMKETDLPTGQVGTHSVLTAHRGLPSAKLFRNLDDFQIGDQFAMRVLDEERWYEVRKRKVVLPEETDWIDQDDSKEWVTLLTCEPYMVNTHRLLLIGERIDKSEVKEISPKRTVYNDFFWLWVALLLITVGSIIVIIRRVRKKKEAEK